MGCRGFRQSSAERWACLRSARSGSLSSGCLRFSGLRQQAEQRLELGLCHVPELLFVCLVYRSVELPQQLEPGVGDAGCNQPAVDSITCASDEPGLFQSVEQTGDVGDLRDQPLTNVLTAETFVSGPAQDPQDIVLSRRDVERLEYLDDRIAQDCVGSSDAEHRLLFEAVKRLGLFDLVTESKWHG